MKSVGSCVLIVSYDVSIKFFSGYVKICSSRFCIVASRHTYAFAQTMLSGTTLLVILSQIEFDVIKAKLIKWLTNIFRRNHCRRAQHCCSANLFTYTVNNITLFQFQISHISEAWACNRHDWVYYCQESMVRCLWYLKKLFSLF